MKTIKKIMAIGVIGLMSMGALAGCSKTVKYDEDQVADMIAKAKADAIAGVDITADNTAVIDAAIADAVANGTLVTEADMAELSDELDIAKEDLEKVKEIIEEYKQIEEDLSTETEAKESLQDIELAIGESFGEHTYDDSDIGVLKDGEVKFDGDEYDFEELVITHGDLTLGYSLIDEEDFGADSYVMTTDKGALEYKFSFEDPIDYEEISRDEPLTIDFLGKELTITDVKHDEFEVRAGNKVWVATGDEVTVDNKVIKVLSVDEDGESAAIEVDGTMEWIDEGDEETINGLTVAIENVIAVHSDSAAGDVKLVISSDEDVYQTYEVGDSVIYDEDEDDAEWVYTLDVDGEDLNSIGVKYNQKADELDDDFTPLALGESISFPNDYLDLTFGETNVQDYMTVDVEFDEFEDELDNDHNGIVFTASDDEGFEIAGEEVDTVYAYRVDKYDWKLLYEDDEGDMVTTDEAIFKVIFGDTEYIAGYDANTVHVDYLEFKPGREDGEFIRLGPEAEDAESQDVLYNGIEIGTAEYDVLGFDGMVIKDVENNAEDDKIEFEVPDDEVEYTAYLG